MAPRDPGAVSLSALITSDLPEPQEHADQLNAEYGDFARLICVQLVRGLYRPAGWTSRRLCIRCGNSSEVKSTNKWEVLDDSFYEEDLVLNEWVFGINDEWCTCGYCFSPCYRVLERELVAHRNGDGVISSDEYYGILNIGPNSVPTLPDILEESEPESEDWYPVGPADSSDSDVDAFDLPLCVMGRPVEDLPSAYCRSCTK
ncbi:uncharacterized protein LOC127751058 isoform X2 [Frankliniella occidentalis]|uniref:Uncharacterized protein LOC127751058 isoform X2 n=1 Tax=Frankliniella occidentalis TaxID=133901 RepID=A0A9C6XSU1_FRAOC|nr:uncharacterized protein LOC127751058 isoform X2 [Frankliniella occidentalis]